MLKKLVFGALATLTLAAPAIAGDRGHERPRHYDGYERHGQRHAERHYRPAYSSAAARRHAPAPSHAPAPHDFRHDARPSHGAPAAHGGISIGLHLPL